jgi:hypothetical protein
MILWILHKTAGAGPVCSLIYGLTYLRVWYNYRGGWGSDENANGK